MGKTPVIKYSFAPLVLSIAVLVSCQPPKQEKPLDPRLLFTIGSDFLKDAETIAVKGTMEFDDGRSSESASFQFLAKSEDSLLIFVEGPLGIDLFQMAVIGDTAFIKSKNLPEWEIYHTGDLFDIPEYEIVELNPFLLGIYCFPQLYFGGIKFSESLSGDNLISGRFEFAVHQPKKQNSFVLAEVNSRFMAAYSGRKEFDGGYYPSSIEITPDNSKWRISARIKKLKINPPIPDKLWQITR